MAPSISRIRLSARRIRIAPALAILLSALAPLPAFAFDGERALESIRAQCDLGPRVPGTPAHARGIEWIDGQIRELGMTVRRDTFDTRLPLTGQRVEACNLWGLPSAAGPTSPAILLSAHWDTRPWADREPGGGNPPLLGANDGGSGVAMVLELARQLRQGPLADRVAIAFWDAEDSGVQEDLESWALGATHAAQHPPAWIDRVALGINFDMVAGADLLLRRELHSVQAAPDAVAGIWGLGRALAPDRFFDGAPIQIIDDHLPWIRAGLPYVNLIGFPYRHWHTSRDTPDNCDPEVMRQLGDVVLHYLTLEDWPAHGRSVGPQPAAAP
jgi:hypothetical protein